MNDAEKGDEILVKYSKYEDVDDALINMDAKIQQLQAELADKAELVSLNKAANMLLSAEVEQLQTEIERYEKELKNTADVLQKILPIGEVKAIGLLVALGNAKP